MYLFFFKSFFFEPMIKIHGVALVILITGGLVGESFEGDHNLQRRYRCELDGDGSRRGSIQYYFDGDDFISLGLTPGTWKTANARAENFITEWDCEGDQAEYWKNYLNNTCIKTLMQYVQSRTNTEERKGTHTLHSYITDITGGISYTVGELDGEQFVYFGSNITEVILKTEWMKKIDTDDPNYRKREKDRMSDDHGDLQELLNQAKKHFNQTKGENKVSPTDEESSKSNVALGAAIGVVVVVLLIAVVYIIYRKNNNSDLTQMKPVNALLMSSSGTDGYIQVSSV